MMVNVTHTFKKIVPTHANKEYKERRVIAPLIVNLSSRWR
jgi:hypothetical protein